MDLTGSKVRKNYSLILSENHKLCYTSIFLSLFCLLLLVFLIIFFQFSRDLGTLLLFCVTQKELAINSGCLQIPNLSASRQHTWLKPGVQHFLLNCCISYSPQAVQSWLTRPLQKKPLSVSFVDSLHTTTFVFYLLFQIFISLFQCSIIPYKITAALLTPRFARLVPVNSSGPIFLIGFSYKAFI